MKGSSTGSLSGEVEPAGTTEVSDAASSTSPVVDATTRDVKIALSQTFNDMRPLRPPTWFEEDPVAHTQSAKTGETVEANEAAMKAKLKEIREQKKKEAQAKKAAKKAKGAGSEEKPSKTKKSEEASRPHPQT